MNNRINIKNIIEGPLLVVPPKVRKTAAELNLRWKDVVYTASYPHREKKLPDNRYIRELVFAEGTYTTGLLMKWSEREAKWVVLSCWRKDLTT